MIKENVWEILKTTRAVLNGHFLLSSGLHSDTYIQCAKALQYPKYTRYIASLLTERFENEKPKIVIGLALGGIILAYEIARKMNVRTLFTERERGEMKLRRGFEIFPNEKILIVEDVITTGNSVKEVIQLIKGYGGNIIGIGAIVDRSNKTLQFGVKFESLVKLDVFTYKPNECPLCNRNIPLNKPGSRGNN